MGLTYVDVAIRNPLRTDSVRPVEHLLVDTGSELTWVSGAFLREIGIAPVKQRRFVLADRRELRRPVGFAIIEMGKHRTIDEVVFGEPDDLSLLGARTLEGFGLSIAPQSHRFRATPTIAAARMLSPLGPKASVLR